MKRGQRQHPHGGPQPGWVVQRFGRRFRVETADGVLDCVTRGKKTDVACGDRVTILVTGKGEGVIESVEPRHALLYRQDENREKLIAANVTQVLLVVAGRPACHDSMLNRTLVAAEAAELPVTIVLNKVDLPETTALRERLSVFQKLGYRVAELSAKQDVSPLRPLLDGQVSVFVGQSGMGKSTLVNALVPEAAARVGEISEALNAGTHTTTYASLYHLDANSHLIDSPGMQEFGLHHVEPRHLEWCFPEFRPYAGQCRFHNCWHRVEPGCAISAAAEAGDIAPTRLAFYRDLLAERPVK